MDSTGTDFLTIFPWNNNNVDAQPAVSMDFINSNENQVATIDLTYSVYTIAADEISTSVKTSRLTVNAKSRTRANLLLFLADI